MKSTLQRAREFLRSPRMKRRMRFTKPRDQIWLMLPTMAVFLIGASLAFFVLSSVERAAMNALFEHGVKEEGLREFARLLGGYSTFLALALLGLGVVAFYWAWLLSFRVFGPIPRLERELCAIRDGIMDPAGLKVRKGDALYSVIELFRHLLESRR